MNNTQNIQNDFTLEEILVAVDAMILEELKEFEIE